MNQTGSASLVALTGLAALAFTTIFVSLRQKEINQDVEKSRISNSRNLAETLNLSNISTFKALVNEAKIGAGYEPALYPANYFESQWTFLKNPNLILTHVTVSQGKVHLGSLATNHAHYEDFLNVLKGTDSVLNKLTQPAAVEIVRQNSRPGHPYYIESVDVRTGSSLERSQSYSAKALNATARINLVPPYPTALSLWVKAPGQATFSQDFGSTGSGLPAGDYVFQVRASGVVHYAEIEMSGQSSILGIDGTSGQIVHSANNIKAQDVVLGEIVKSILPGGTTSGRAAFQGCAISVDYGVGGGNVVGVPIRVSAYAVDGTESTGLRVEKNLFVTSATQQTAQAGPGARACESSCPIRYWEDIAQVPGALVTHFDKSLLGITDPKQLDTADWNETNNLIDGGGKGLICGNQELIAEALHQASGLLPSQYNAANPDAFTTTYGNNYHLFRYFAYLAPACERQLLGTRDSCGCFQENTRIRMADGTDRPVRLIRQGDWVWNPRLQKPSRVARVIAGPEKFPLLRVTTTFGAVEVTGEHPFLTTSGLRKAHELLKDEVIVNGSQAETVLEIVPLSQDAAEHPTVWNLSLEGSTLQDDEHYILANGIMTGDLLLQERLGSQASGRRDEK
ncbi:MAG TPA: hypothetical protein VE954_32695 [Oligoflexus sp.]|nr:hypothetical protein [Oligoflexus sp.]